MKRLQLLAILLLTLLVTATVYADAAGELQEMFENYGFRSTSTDGGAYWSQSRGFLVGGTVKARTRSKTIQPVSLKMPSVKAGCGGIDLFGGAFNFINGDEFKAWLEAVGQNAVGYAFSLALEVTCPTCNGVIKWLRDVMNSLNKFGLDSCMAAEALVNTAGTAVGAWELEKCKSTEGNTPKLFGGGNYVDSTLGWIKCAADSEPNISQRISDSTRAESEDGLTSNEKKGSRGATMHQMLRGITVNGSAMDEETKRLIMSLLGTYYSLSDTSSPGVGSCEFYPPTMGLRELINGGDVDMLKCGTGDLTGTSLCEDVEAETVTIEGFLVKSQNMMTGILANLKNRIAITEIQQRFINQVPVPLLLMLQTALQYDENLADAMVADLAPTIAVMVAWHATEEYVKLVLRTIDKVTACGLKKEDLMEQVRNVREERQQLYQQAYNELQVKMTMLQTQMFLNKGVTQAASKNSTSMDSGGR